MFIFRNSENIYKNAMKDYGQPNRQSWTDQTDVVRIGHEGEMLENIVDGKVSSFSRVGDIKKRLCSPE